MHATPSLHMLQTPPSPFQHGVSPLFSIHKNNNCYTLEHILIMYLIKCTHAQTLNFTRRGCCVEYRASAPDLKASPAPQMWHQLVLSPALPPPFPCSLPLSYPLSSAEPIFWHFRRCSSHACHLSPPPPALSSPALYREHASLSETYVLCRVNALAFASPWSR